MISPLRPRRAVALLAALAMLLAACGDDTTEPATDETVEATDTTGSDTTADTTEDTTEGDAGDDSAGDDSAEGDAGEPPGDDGSEGSGDDEAAGEAGADGPVEVSAQVAGGAVTTGADRYDIPLGSEVVLTVSADIAEEVHLHGYDLSADVTPEQPAELRFTADTAGVFEVELEGSATFLFELAVS